MEKGIMGGKRIRPIAICVCQESNRFLVAEHCLRGKYYRLLGGAVEFGERGEHAIRCGMREEIHAELDEVRYLGMPENIYVSGWRLNHEITLVYDARLKDACLHDNETFQGNELANLSRSPGNNRLILERENSLSTLKDCLH
jgi:hypothetical protein